VAVLACDQKLLNQAIRRHWMRRRGALHLTVRGRRAGDSPGLAQALGEPLVAGDPIKITGRGTSRTIFLISVRVGRHLFRGELRYGDLPHQRSVNLKVRVHGSRPTIESAEGPLPARIVRLR
jgi:hypothetical protein